MNYEHSMYISRIHVWACYRPIYTIMNSSSFINTNPIYTWEDFLQAVEPDNFGQTLLSAVLTLLFCIYVLFIQYTCSTYFLFFHIFFLAPNGLQQKQDCKYTATSTLTRLSFMHIFFLSPTKKITFTWKTWEHGRHLSMLQCYIKQWF